MGAVCHKHVKKAGQTGQVRTQEKKPSKIVETHVKSEVKIIDTKSAGGPKGDVSKNPDSKAEGQHVTTHVNRHMERLGSEYIPISDAIGRHVAAPHESDQHSSKSSSQSRKSWEMKRDRLRATTGNSIYLTGDVLAQYSKVKIHQCMHQSSGKLFTMKYVTVKTV